MLLGGEVGVIDEIDDGVEGGGGGYLALQN